MAANTEPTKQQIGVLIGTLNRLANSIDDLLVDQFALKAMWRAGREAGEEAAREALLGKAAATTPARPRSATRPQHLQPVDGGAS